MDDQNTHDNPEWMDVKAVSQYACVSERTLREWIRRPVDPLPAVRVGGKILVRKTTFDVWLESQGDSFRSRTYLGGDDPGFQMSTLEVKLRKQVKLRKRGKSWYIFWAFQGQRGAQSVGPDKRRADCLFRQFVAKLLSEGPTKASYSEGRVPTKFGEYARRWLTQEASLHCKPSTIVGYESIVQTRLIPEFGANRLDHLTRSGVKDFLFRLNQRGLSSNTLRNTLCLLRAILNQAVEDELIQKTRLSGWDAS